MTRSGVGPLQKPLWTTSGPGYCFRGGGKVSSEKKPGPSPGFVFSRPFRDRKDTGQLHAGKSSIWFGHEQPICPSVCSHAAFPCTWAGKGVHGKLAICMIVLFCVFLDWLSLYSLKERLEELGAGQPDGMCSLNLLFWRDGKDASRSHRCPGAFPGAVSCCVSH